MLPDKIRSVIEEQLSGKITGVKYVSGGSINDAARIEVHGLPYFLKWNSAARFPGMFSAEVKGLNILREGSGFVVPETVMTGEAGEHSFLLMRFIERTQPNWNEAGKVLANMHRASAKDTHLFGLDHDNYIGSLKQQNNFHATWSGFFSTERILPQMKTAIDNGQLSRSDLLSAEHFCKRIDDIFPKEKPALLHGDLWSGNFMFTVNGPALYDPAVYFGHREMDLAMTKLFGGFEDGFYAGYNEFHALEKNWKQRVDYCNLYPLLVHVNLFGGGYVQDVKQILRHFT